jgi:hypothetical protein
MASLIEVFDLYAVIFLVSCITEGTKLLLHGLLIVPPNGCGLPKHPAFSENLKSETNALSY